jgi:asparagine synthase (glutamine-hydrolysing)
MCGIAGVMSSRPGAGAEAGMIAALSHRGPDDQGVVSLEAGGRWVSLGSTRLAIIDLSPAGHMPMQDPSSGNWIAYNGEVYNFRELREQLESYGETFSSGTDTEVILKGYRRWREDVVGRLRGMFAFAIWNQASQELFLARDRLGEKPLYYHASPAGTFVFASEVRALLGSGLIDRRLDEDAAAGFLGSGFMTSPLTTVRGVRSLLPAHWMRVSREGRVLERVQYWRPVAPSPPCGEDGEGLLGETLAEAVRMRLVSDVPIGAFLSGGLDSSILVALMARAGPRVRTFSVTFDEADYDESVYSSWVAKRFGTEHSEVRLRAADFTGWLSAALDAMDQPTFDGINTYCVARAAKATGLTVALSGLGADEIFGGYPFFRTVPWLRRLAWLAGSLPYSVRRSLDARLVCRGLRVAAPWKLAEAWGEPGHGQTGNVPAMLAAYQATQLLFPRWVRERLLSPGPNHDGTGHAFGLPEEFLAFLQSDADAGGADNAVSLLALRLFLGERCLRDTDTMSMAVSLEVRAAFTDHPFLQEALGVPAERRCQGAPHKPFLRSLFRQHLGADYPSRKKQGFRLPLDTWLRSGRILGLIQDALSNRRLLSEVGLDTGAVSGLLAAYRRGRPRIPWSRLWALYVFVRWCEKNRVSL